MSSYRSPLMQQITYWLKSLTVAVAIATAVPLTTGAETTDPVGTLPPNWETTDSATNLPSNWETTESVAAFPSNWEATDSVIDITPPELETTESEADAPSELETTDPVAALPPPDFDPIEIKVPPPKSSSDRVCPEFIDLFVDSIVDRPAFRSAKWGILVASADGTTFYSRNSNTRLIPASNTKLLTTAAALQRLSSDTRIRGTSLKSWITVTNRDSNNNYAEVLLRTLGGSRAARQSLVNLGINSGGFRQADGSGLSRNNSISPTALVDLLQTMTSAKGSDVFYQSLPIAGQTGTLRKRFRNTPAQGKVRAKTGTLRGVRALSGYLEHPEYDKIVFSILINQPGQSGNTMLRAIDDVVVQLTKLTPCN